MSHYFPMAAYPDFMPVDISFVFEDEKPAGKHGFLHVEKDNFVFEDGTPAKFWGVNLNGAACFPDKEYAPKVARRLAQAGCNIVRFHQLDAEFGTPNIFNFTKGRHVRTTRKLDERSLDALDYLIYCLKEEGIYCYLDMLTYRQFKEADGVKDAQYLQPGAKPWCCLDPVLLELQKEFMTQMWTHYNPYTKLAYKDDPVFVMCEIVNESDLFQKGGNTIFNKPGHEYYHRQMKEAFRDWLAASNREYDWENANLKALDKEVIDFKLDVTWKYYDMMYKHMRELGVKIPLTGSNWICTGYDWHRSHKYMDFHDTHPYVYSWSWGNNRRFYTEPITATANYHNFGATAHMSVPDKPLFLSEWDMPWPNAYRAESPIYYAALCCLQNWAGAASHTYAYTTRISQFDPVGRETTTQIGGSQSREGIFTIWNDWARFGLFAHAALMLRRGDIRPADRKVALIPDESIYEETAQAYRDGVEICKLAVTLDGSLPEGYDEVISESDHIPSADPNMLVSCTGEMKRHLTRQVGIIDTDRSKIVYGKLPSAAAPGMEMDGIQIKATTTFGVIALASLSDDPIATSENMLLSAIGIIRNDGQICDGDHLGEFGNAPIMAELIQATIRLKTVHGDRIKVWGINDKSSYVKQMPVTVEEDGYISFKIGDPEAPAMYYLVYKD